MNTPDKCPKCQSDRLTNFTGLRFECGSWFSASGQAMHQSHLCIVSERDALAARVKELEAVCNDLQALWANWLCGTVALPAGIGDVRERDACIKELEDELKDLRRLESLVSDLERLLSAEGVNAKMVRLIAAGDAFAETAEPTAWENWVKAKEAKP